MFKFLYYLYLSCRTDTLYSPFSGLSTVLMRYLICFFKNFFDKWVDFSFLLCYLICVANNGVWLSLVERFVRDEEVACSNHVTPTTRPLIIKTGGFSFVYNYRSMPVITAGSYLPCCHQVVYVRRVHVELQKCGGFFTETSCRFINIYYYRQ